MDIFNRSGEQLTGIIYKSITDYGTFTHLKSIFKDGWYNFIIPTVTSDKLDWDKAKQMIIEEEKDGYELTYAIKEELLENYKPVIEKEGLQDFGTMFYMTKTLSSKPDKFQGEFEEVSDENIEKQKEMGRECFPEWPNTNEYCDLFLGFHKNNTDHVFKNLLYKVNGEYVGFCSVIISKKFNLAYLHNTGVLASHRRKGYFSDMVNYRCNLALENGVSEIFSIVEENAGSYPGFLKLGFVAEEKYYCFTTK